MLSLKWIAHYRILQNQAIKILSHQWNTLVELVPLPWRHNEHNCVSNHQPCDDLLNRLFRCRSKKTPKLRVTCLCAANSPVTGEFSAQMANNEENVSCWWRHHAIEILLLHVVASNVRVLKVLSNVYRSSITNYIDHPIARFMGPTWGPSGADRTQMGPMLAPWTLLSGHVLPQWISKA